MKRNILFCIWILVYSPCIKARSAPLFCGNELFPETRRKNYQELEPYFDDPFTSYLPAGKCHQDSLAGKVMVCEVWNKDVKKNTEL